MKLEWNELALLGAIPASVCWLLAATVYFAAPRMIANRRLAVALSLYGAVYATEATLARLASSPVDAYAWTIVGNAAVLALLPCYLLFLTTLNSPWVRPLKGKVGTWSLRCLAVALPTIVVLRPQYIIADVTSGGTLPFAYILGPAHTFYQGGQFALASFGLFVAWSAYRHSGQGTIAKQRARAYLWAFGLHDALWALQLALVSTLVPSPPSPSVYRFWEVEFLIFRAVVPTLFAILLAYAILRWQLFDLELKVKRGIARIGVGGMMAAIFFMTAALAEQFLERTGTIVGGVAVGLLLFAARPLERGAMRIMDGAWPEASGYPAYLVYRKLLVYRNAVETVRVQGEVGPEGRAFLDDLARELSISPEDAHAIEDEVRTISRSQG